MTCNIPRISHELRTWIDGSYLLRPTNLSSVEPGGQTERSAVPEKIADGASLYESWSKVQPRYRRLYDAPGVWVYFCSSKRRTYPDTSYFFQLIPVAAAFDLDEIEPVNHFPRIMESDTLMHFEDRKHNPRISEEFTRAPAVSRDTGRPAAGIPANRVRQAALDFRFRLSPAICPSQRRWFGQPPAGHLDLGWHPYLFVDFHCFAISPARLAAHTAPTAATMSVSSLNKVGVSEFGTAKMLQTMRLCGDILDNITQTASTW